MRIERLDLTAFGKFTDSVIDFSVSSAAEPVRRFHLVVGPNESGKSTSLRAIKSLLYGFPQLAQDNYIHTNAQMRVGGVLVHDDGTRLECVRRRGRKATLRDASDDAEVDESELLSMLGGVDRDSFEARFGLSHDELVRGGAQILSGEGDLGELLFSAGAGVSRLHDVRVQLDDAAGRLFNPRGSKPAINSLLRTLDERRKELRQIQLAPASYEDLRRRLADAMKESSRLKESASECTVRLSRMKSMAQASSLIPKWDSTTKAIAELALVPLLDDQFTERRRQAVSELEIASRQSAELTSRRKELETRLERLPVDSVVLQHESEIQSLFQQISTHEKAELDCKNLERLAKNNNRKIAELLGELGVDFRIDRDSDEEMDAALRGVHVSETLRTRIRGLASKQEKLIAQRNDASDTLEATKRRLSDTLQEMESIGAVGDPAALTSAIESIGNPQDLIEASAEQAASCDSLRQRCESIATRLDGFRGPIGEAAEIRPPDETEIHQSVQRRDAASQRQDAIRHRLEQLTREADELRSQLASDPALADLPTMESLAEHRASRDGLLEKVAQAVREGTDAARPLQQLRQAVSRVDQIVDSIHRHHEQVHQSESVRQRLIRLDQLKLRESEALKEAEEECRSVETDWRELWLARGVEPQSPRRMQRWLADHELLCQTVVSLTENESKLEQTGQRIARAEKRLRRLVESNDVRRAMSVVAANQDAANREGTGQVDGHDADAARGGLFDPPDERELASLFDDAVSIRNDWLRQSQAYQTLSRRRDELADQLPRIETRYESLQESVAQWHREWKQMTSTFRSDDVDVSPPEMLQMLDHVMALEQRKKDRDIHASRIASIRRDKADFDARVRRVAVITEESRDSDGLPAEAVAQKVYQRLQAERSTSRERETLRQQLEATFDKLVELSAEISARRVMLQQLCDEAGCEAPDDLPALERSSRERRDRENEFRDLENQLNLLAGEVPLNEFIDATSSQDPALLSAQIEETGDRQRQLREDAAEADRKVGALRHEIESMNGGSEASEVSQSMQLIVGEIGRTAEDYARLRTASMILRRAIEHYRQANQNPVLALAERSFGRLTCGEYASLKVDYDSKGRSTLFGVRADASPDVPARDMSTGTADSLYLALRLASLQHQLRHGRTLPLIVDDCLIQLDDRRASAALEVLSELSETTQVILLTHHQHVIDLAGKTLREGQFHMHQLGC